MTALTYATRFPLEQISLRPLSESIPAAELAVNDEFVSAKGGKVRLPKPGELPEGWDPGP